MNLASSTHDGAGADYVARFTEVWKQPDPETLANMLTPFAWASAPLTPDARGYEEIKRVFADALTLMPDMRAQVHGWAPHQDGVFIEFTLSGNLGGRSVSWNAVDRFVLDGPRASERVSYFDSLPLLSRALRTPRAWPGLLRARALPRGSTVTMAESCALPEEDATDTAERFVARLAAYWARPTVEGLLGLLAEGPLDIDLPVLGRMHSHSDARAALRRRLKLTPELTGKVTRWGAHESSVYIELQFTLPDGRRAIRWNAVNRLQLRGGAVLSARSYEDRLMRLQRLTTHPRLLLSLLRSVTR